jgi:hypothetical protein
LFLCEILLLTGRSENPPSVLAHAIFPSGPFLPFSKAEKPGSQVGWVEERNPTSKIAQNCKMIERTISAQQPYFVGIRKLNPTHELFIGAKVPHLALLSQEELVSEELVSEELVSKNWCQTLKNWCQTLIISFSRVGWVKERNQTSTSARNRKMIERIISVQQAYFVGFHKLNPTYTL